MGCSSTKGVSAAGPRSACGGLHGGAPNLLLSQGSPLSCAKSPSVGSTEPPPSVSALASGNGSVGGPSALGGPAFQAQAAQVATAVRECQAKLAAGDATAAEQVLCRAVSEVQGCGLPPRARHVLLSQLRSSEAYDETLGLLRAMERAAQQALGQDGHGGEWLLASEVKTDFESLGFLVDAQTREAMGPGGDIIKIYYKVTGREVEFRIDTVLPARTPGGLPPLTGLVAMFHETDLWSTWHPAVIAPGPVKLEEHKAFNNLWHLPQAALLRKTSEIQRCRTFWLRDAGIFVMSSEGSAPKDPIYDKFPPPSGCSRFKGKSGMQLVFVPQKDTALLGISISIVPDGPLPNFVFKFVASWLLPELVRRILRTGTECLKNAGPHQPLLEADADGLYAECKRISAVGADLDRVTGRGAFVPGATPAGLVRDRPRNLLVIEEALRSASPLPDAGPSAAEVALCASPSSPTMNKGVASPGAPLPRMASPQSGIAAGFAGLGAAPGASTPGGAENSPAGGTACGFSFGGLLAC